MARAINNRHSDNWWLETIASTVSQDSNGTGTLNTSESQGSPTANTPSISSSSTALASNANRRGWQIQNVGTNPLFVLLGSGASTAVFHAVLKGGIVASDGLGGSWSQTGGRVYTGIITVAGTSPSYVAMEI